MTPDVIFVLQEYWSAAYLCLSSEWRKGNFNDTISFLTDGIGLNFQTVMTFSKSYIGGAAFGSGTETNFVGLMDNFRIYDKVLTPDQIYTDFYKK